MQFELAHTPKIEDIPIKVNYYRQLVMVKTPVAIMVEMKEE